MIPYLYQHTIPFLERTPPYLASPQSFSSSYSSSPRDERLIYTLGSLPSLTLYPQAFHKLYTPQSLKQCFRVAPIIFSVMLAWHKPLTRPYPYQQMILFLEKASPYLTGTQSSLSS